MTPYDFGTKVLTQCCKAVYHIKSDKEPNEYIVWFEVGARSSNGDNQRVEESALIGVDFFTKEEFSEVPAKLKDVLREYGIPYRGPEIIYDEATDKRQYAYTVEVI